MRMRQPSAPPLPQGEAQTAPAWDCQWHFTVTALRDHQGCAPRTASDSPGDEALCPRRASGEHGATRGAMGTGCQHHPAAASPGVPSPPPVLTVCPAPSPQGFPPSQPLQPGGRESRAADGPRSPRPAESKVGTGLGARRRCARLAPELRAPSSHRQLLGWGPLAAAPPRCLPSSLQSALRRPARRLLSPALTNSFLLVPKGTLSGVAGTPQPVSRLAASLQIHVPAEAGGSREPRAGGVLVGSTKMLLSSCLASIHLLCPAWGGGLVPSVKSGR